MLKLHVSEETKNQAEVHLATTTVSTSVPKVPSLDRLAQIASNMSLLEWKLLKSKAKSSAIGK